MVWGQIIPLFLLTILHGGCGKSLCSVETCRCGENVTVTCKLTYPPQEIYLKYNYERTLFINLTKREGSDNNGTTVIEWAEDKVKVHISKVMISDADKYDLTLHEASKGNQREIIKINVYGICKPNIYKNSNTGELECEAESDKNASIVWNLNNLNSTTSATELGKSYKLRSSLKLTEEIMNKTICCYVSTEKESGTSHGSRNTCWPGNDELTVLETRNKQLSSENPTLSAFLILLAVALVAFAFWYLLKRRNMGIVEEAPEEQNSHPHCCQKLYNIDKLLGSQRRNIFTI